jgi:hypothetical protein
MGRNSWPFTGSLSADKRAAEIMSLVHPARVNGITPSYVENTIGKPSRRVNTEPRYGSDAINWKRFIYQ